MTDRLGEILSEVSTEKRLEEQRERERDALRQAAIAAVKISNAARARMYAPDAEPLGDKRQAERAYRRVRAAQEMKRLQGKVSE